MTTASDAGGSTFFPREYLRGALGAGRLSHAYLFLGREGSGRLGFATEFAKTLFCGGARADGDDGPAACGGCPSCRSIDHGNHPGFTVYGPAEGRTVIDIDTVRELCERSHYARDHAFVAVVRRADVLTVPAANALLKTLEEPDGEFILVLTAPSTGALLPTVVSRCHRLYFPSTEPAAGGGEVDASVLDEARAPDFIARQDIRGWLSRLVPANLGARDRVRELNAHLVDRSRRELAEAGRGGDVDACLERLEVLLELRADLEANVNPDLVLERTLAAVLRPSAG